MYKRKRCALAPLRNLAAGICLLIGGIYCYDTDNKDEDQAIAFLCMCIGAIMAAFSLLRFFVRLLRKR